MAMRMVVAWGTKTTFVPRVTIRTIALDPVPWYGVWTETRKGYET